MKSKKLVDDLYKNEFLILWDIQDEDLEAAKKQSERYLGCTSLNLMDTMQAACINLLPPSGRYVLFFLPETSLYAQISHIAHECLHAAQTVFSAHNIVWDIESDRQEPQCYYTSWLIRRVCEIMQLDKQP